MNTLGRLNFSVRISSVFHYRSSSFVPKTPIFKETTKNSATESLTIDTETIQHLERLSLVDFANRAGIHRLKEAIKFADQILHVDTNSVKPLISVLHEDCLPVRTDVVTEGNIRDEILSNAFITEEEYFLAPPGNIPLPPKETV